MRLLLVRHGETLGNVERKLQGADDPLTERGRRQAHEISAHLSGREDIMALYTSPFARAVETAQAIGEALRLDPVSRDGLAEVDVGRASGYRFEEWAELFPEEAEKFQTQGMDYAWPEGESGHDVSARAAAELNSILADHRDASDTVVVVSHGGTLAWIISHLLQEPGDEWPHEHMRLENCSITEVDVQEDGPASFLYTNEIGHLSPSPDAEAATGDEEIA
jgi:probable phosphoglycerate mutase